MPAREADIGVAYLVHREQILGRVARAARDPELAEDVLQEAFVRLIVASRSDGLPANVGGWLHRVSMNLLADRARRQHPVGALAFPQGAEDEPEERALVHERESAVRAALAQLPAEARQALIMDGAGYRSDEIGHAIGRTARATRTFLCRARKRAKELLLSQQA